MVKPPQLGSQFLGCFVPDALMGTPRPSKRQRRQSLAPLRFRNPSALGNGLQNTVPCGRGKEEEIGQPLAEAWWPPTGGLRSLLALISMCSLFPPKVGNVSLLVGFRTREGTGRQI